MQGTEKRDEFLRKFMDNHISVKVMLEISDRMCGKTSLEAEAIAAQAIIDLEAGKYDRWADPRRNNNLG